MLSCRINKPDPVRDKLQDIMFYTYVLQSMKDGKFYTGYTRDLRKRFSDHNSGKVFSTKGRGPFRIIYYEACLDEHDAKATEIYLNPVRSKIINLFHIFNVS